MTTLGKAAAQMPPAPTHSQRTCTMLFVTSELKRLVPFSGLREEAVAKHIAKMQQEREVILTVSMGQYLTFCCR